MIIHPPELTQNGDRVRFSARIDVETPGVETPDALWFQFDEKYGEFITENGDPLIVGLLPVAMRLGEDIVVEPSVSPRLAYGIEQYQHILHAWRPDYFPLIDIRYVHLEARARPGNPGAVGTLFSDGVDSFYTLWRRLSDREPVPEYQITHAVMINGFHNYEDLDETEFFPDLRRVNQPMFDRLGVEFLVVGSNLGEFRRHAFHRFRGSRSYVTALICGPLVLGGLFSRFYVPGAFSYVGALGAHGSHPITDFLLSTEAFETVHEGAELIREEKVEALADWPETFPLLHPCFRTPTFSDDATTLYNCCRCEKCVRTMITLDLHGALDRYASFPRPLKWWMVLVPWYVDRGSRFYAVRHIRLARRKGRRWMSWAIRYSLLTSRVLGWLAYRRVERRERKSPRPWRAEDGGSATPATKP
jgi:hypothetical protein